MPKKTTPASFGPTTKTENPGPYLPRGTDPADPRLLAEGWRLLSLGETLTADDQYACGSWSGDTFSAIPNSYIGRVVGSHDHSRCIYRRHIQKNPEIEKVPASERKAKWGKGTKLLNVGEFAHARVAYPPEYPHARRLDFMEKVILALIADPTGKHTPDQIMDAARTLADKLYGKVPSDK